MGRRKKNEVIIREIKTSEVKENNEYDLIDGDEEKYKDCKLIRIKIVLGYNILEQHNIEYAQAFKEYLCGKEYAYNKDDEEYVYDEDSSVMLEEYIMDSITGLDVNQDIRVTVNRPYEELDMIEDTTIEFKGISGSSDFASAIMTELPTYLLELQKNDDFISYLKGKNFIDHYEEDEDKFEEKDYDYLYTDE